MVQVYLGLLAPPFRLAHQNNFMENIELSSTPTPQPTIATLATQLHQRLSEALASGEVGEHWRMVERLIFSDAIQTLMTPPRTSPEEND